MRMRMRRMIFMDGGCIDQYRDICIKTIEICTSTLSRLCMAPWEFIAWKSCMYCATTTGEAPIVIHQWRPIQRCVSWTTAIRVTPHTHPSPTRYILKRFICRLQWFLDRIACHPSLQRSQCTRIFLESPDFVSGWMEGIIVRSLINWVSRKMTSVPFKQHTSRSLLPFWIHWVMSWWTPLLRSRNRISASLICKNTWISWRTIYAILNCSMHGSANGKPVCLLHKKVVVRATSFSHSLVTGLQHDYVSFAWSIREISAMESSIDMPLRQFAETTETYSKYLKDMVSACVRGSEQAAVVDPLTKYK